MSLRMQRLYWQLSILQKFEPDRLTIGEVNNVTAKLEPKGLTIAGVASVAGVCNATQKGKWLIALHFLTAQEKTWYSLIKEFETNLIKLVNIEVNKIWVRLFVRS